MDIRKVRNPKTVEKIIKEDYPYAEIVHTHGHIGIWLAGWQEFTFSKATFTIIGGCRSFEYSVKYNYSNFVK